MAESTVPNTFRGRPVQRVDLVVTEGPDSGASASLLDRDLTVGTSDDNVVVLTDPSVSRYHCEIERRGPRVTIRDLGSTNGTRVGPVWLHATEGVVDLPVELRVGRTTIELRDGEIALAPKKPVAKAPAIVSRSPAMLPALEQLEQVSRSTMRVPVLLLGESGTGKELFARTIHQAGDRAQGPFVTVDCAAVTASLLTSELFGYEKGAFTGAQSTRQGAFERAHGGTLFLDEVGELGLDQQTALLGVLERGTFTRVGGSRELRTDVRVLAATNRDLRAEVNRGAFRLDLYYRLAVVLLRIPPLRKRAEDLESLIERFVLEEGGDGSTPLFDAAQLEAMRRHAWPGNVRELRNVVLAAMATGQAPTLSSMEAPSFADGQRFVEGPLPSYKEARAQVTREFEVRYLTALLERAGGSVRQASRLASMDRGYLTELLRRHGLK
ncbi:MAG: sigma 54-interacting transcriptional regulator [Myxococcota bacterium]